MINQPLEEKFKPTRTKESAISFQEFLELLKCEEDFYQGEQHHTKKMVTRLRKIFYDAYGWNSKLIRGAANIPGRYDVRLVSCDNPTRVEKSNGFKPAPKYRKVTVKKGDWMNPNVGTVPEIFANNNQQVILPEGLYCDIGHVLGGIDAYNYLKPVSPLPNCLMFLKRLFPLCDSNMDITTWLGDIASSSGQFLFKQLENKRPLTDQEMQGIINDYAPGVDMLGNIDSYVICQIYNTKAQKGLRVSDMLNDYYSKNGFGNYFLRRRHQFFSYMIGLRNWNGEKFQNEIEWTDYYLKQLKNNNAFYIYSRCENIKGVFLALMTWLGGYKDILKDKLLLNIFLTSLKRNIVKEPDFDLANISNQIKIT